MKDSELFLPHGGYRKLRSFQVARLAYDLTLRFCDRYVDRKSRTHDQMVQAARSGVQNIAEGSLAAATSKKTELRLTNVARASLEELRLDYEDYLRHGGLTQWDSNDPRRQELVDRRCQTADEVVQWVKELHDGGRGGPSGQSGASGEDQAPSSASSPSASAKHPISGIAANALLVLINVACALLDRQLQSLAKTFEKEGGFTENLYKVRTRNRRSN